VSSATSTKELPVQCTLHFNRSDNGDTFGILLCKHQALQISRFITLGSIKQKEKKDTLLMLLWGDVLWTDKYLPMYRKNLLLL
jgi:hypothetical protein